MTNPPRQKGTAGENFFVAILQGAGLDAHRAENNKASHDIRINGTAWQIESKFRKTWAIPAWVRAMRAEAGAAPWALFCKPGDGRSRDGRDTGPIVVFDAAFGAELIRVYQESLTEEVPR